MLIILPKGFNKRINKLLVNYNKNLQKSKDKIMYILSLVTCSDYDNQYTPTFNNTLHSKSLIKKIGKSDSKGFKTIIRFLIDNNFIKKIGNYSVGRFCSRYEIIQIEQGKTEFYKITDSYFINKCNKIAAKNLEFVREVTSKIRTNIEDLVLPLEIRERYNLPTEFFHQKGVTKFCSYNNITEKLYSSGRVFNAITGMKREFRHCFVHKDGSNLTEIDISAAQYYFISVDMNENGFTDIKLNNDLKEGIFYENLMKEIHYTNSRDDFKVELQKSYFNINKSKRSHYIDVAIAKLYPNLKNYIELLDSLPKESSFPFKTIGAYAQRLESDTIVNTIGYDLIDKGIWFVTIHDAILVKEQDVNSAINILETRLESYCSKNTKNYKDIKKDFKIIDKYIDQKVRITNTFIEVGNLGSIKNFKTHCIKILTYLESNKIEITEESLAKYSNAPLTVVKKVYKDYKPNQNNIVSDFNFIKIKEYYDIFPIDKKPSIRNIMSKVGLSSNTVQKYLKLINETNV